MNAQQACRQSGILHALGLGRRAKCGKCGDSKRHRARLFFLEPLEDRRLLSVCIWEGGGSDNHWSNPANWAWGVVPGPDDNLVFRGTALTQTENDLPSGTAFRAVSFLSGDFVITGNGLAVTNRILVGPDASGATFVAEVALNGDVLATIVGGPLSFSGAVSGSGSLTENGNCSAIRALEHELVHVRGGDEKAAYKRSCEILAQQECWSCKLEPREYKEKMKQCRSEEVKKSTGPVNEATIKQGCQNVCDKYKQNLKKK